MTDNANDDEQKKEPVHNVISETQKYFEESQRFHAEKAQQYGHARDILEPLKQIPKEYLEPFADGYSRFRDLAKANLAKEITLYTPFNPVLGATAMFGTSTVALAPSGVAAWKEHLVRWNAAPPPDWNPEHSQQYADRLAKLDPELGKMYKGIADAFWGLPDNQERVAFGLARQCFDHLFAILSPDDDAVRKSQFFNEKTGAPKPEAVSRPERVKYAAATRIKNKVQGDFLAEQASKFADEYNELQRLHVREPIDRQRARGVLKTFMATMEQWVDALEL